MAEDLILFICSVSAYETVNIVNTVSALEPFVFEPVLGFDENYFITAYTLSSQTSLHSYMFLSNSAYCLATANQ